MLFGSEFDYGDPGLEFNPQYGIENLFKPIYYIIILAFRLGKHVILFK